MTHVFQKAMLKYNILRSSCRVLILILQILTWMLLVKYRIEFWQNQGLNKLLFQKYQVASKDHCKP